MSLVYENKKKFYRRKSMRAANEKLIINGPRKQELPQRVY